MKIRYRNTDDDSDSEDEEKHIKCVHNNIYFYCSVSRKSVIKLNTLLEELQQKILNYELKEKDINVYIQSEGGDLFSGISAMTYIQNMTVRVNTVIDGFVASAASIIALGGHYIYMQKYATLLIHQISTGFFGKYEEFMDEAKNNKQVMVTVRKIYNENTSIPKEKLDIYLKKDVYVDAATCLKYHIIHEIF